MYNFLFPSQVNAISSLRLYIPKDLLPLEARENTLKKVMETLSRFSEKGLPLLDPEEDMKVWCLSICFPHFYYFPIILSLSRFLYFSDTK